MYIETISTCDSITPEGVGNPFTNRDISRSACEPAKKVVTIAAIFLRAIGRGQSPRRGAAYDMAAAWAGARDGHELR